MSLTPEQVELATTLTSKHKWKRRFISKPDHMIKNTHECVKCGLGRGTVKEHWKYHQTVYFTPDKILSTDRVPFSCGDEWIGGELPINSNKTDFICEEEFKV